MTEFKDWWDTEVDYSDSDGDRYVRVRGIAYSAWTAAKADSQAEIKRLKKELAEANLEIERFLHDVDENDPINDETLVTEHD